MRRRAAALPRIKPNARARGAQKFKRRMHLSQLPAREATETAAARVLQCSLVQCDIAGAAPCIRFRMPGPLILVVS
jgi:hypothetical protein